MVLDDLSLPVVTPFLVNLSYRRQNKYCQVCHHLTLSTSFEERVHLRFDRFIGNGFLARFHALPQSSFATYICNKFPTLGRLFSYGAVLVFILFSLSSCKSVFLYVHFLSSTSNLPSTINMFCSNCGHIVTLLPSFLPQSGASYYHYPVAFA